MKRLLIVTKLNFCNLPFGFAFAFLAWGLFFSTVVNPAEAQDSTAKKTVVLVHGAFTDGSSWDKVIPILQARGLNVVAVQNPLTSLADDVAATRRAIDASKGQVILVGHSWGGSVITEAGNDEKVSALVYVAAFAPSKDQTSNDLSKDYPKPGWLGSLRVDSGGFLTLSPVFAKCFDEKISEAAWSGKPSWYVVATLDRMINPDLQKFLAKKIGARATVLQTGHVPMISKPEEVAKVIIAAAESSKK
jgi:pimeloyl-ACP methyl ester carboxylesterase